MMERVRDIVRDMVPFMRHMLTSEEQTLGVHLRGNHSLYESLVGVIRAKIEGRASLPEPSDPLECKSRLARDHELRWLLSRLRTIYRSPVLQPADRNGEPPE